MGGNPLDASSGVGDTYRYFTYRDLRAVAKSALKLRASNRLRTISRDHAFILNRVGVYHYRSCDYQITEVDSNRNYEILFVRQK